MTYNRMEAKPIVGEHCRFWISGHHAMTKSMRKTRSIGRDIEGWDVSEVQIPGTKIGLWRSFLDTLGTDQ